MRVSTLLPLKVKNKSGVVSSPELVYNELEDLLTFSKADNLFIQYYIFAAKMCVFQTAIIYNRWLVWPRYKRKNFPDRTVQIS